MCIAQSVRRSTREIASTRSAARVAYERSVTRDDASTQRDHTRSAAAFHAFVGAVIERALAAFARKARAKVRVIHHEIRVASDGNRALARKQSEEFRRLRTRGIHQRAQVDTPSDHAVRVQQINALLNRTDAVGHRGKRVATERLLRRKVEWRVIGADGGNLAPRDRAPQT